MSEKKDKEELEFSSPNFNPSKALKYPDRVKLPCPSAPLLDNISCFMETSEGIFPKPKRQPKERKPKESLPTAGTSNDQSAGNEVDNKKEMKKVKNVLTRMENTVKGPLTFVKKCFDEKLRVKVYIRSAVQIRGYCLGFVVAFDKHMNLVLQDVFETWTRKRKRKTPFLGPVQAPEMTEDSKNNILSRIPEQGEYHKRSTFSDKKPTIVVRKRLKRREICERHIDQILIRGEQIVIITLETNIDYKIFKKETPSLDEEAK